MMNRFLIFFFAFSLGISFSSLANNLKDKEHPVQVGAQAVKLADGSTALAVNFVNAEGWHTYWKNPGDAGLPIKVEFFEDKNKLNTTELEWPAPKKYVEDGNLIAYGYSNAYTLFFRIEKELLTKLQNKNIVAKANWLVCKNICIPGKQEISFILSDKNYRPTQANKVVLATEELEKRFQNLPQIRPWPKELSVELLRRKDKKGLHLVYQGKFEKLVGKGHNLLTPFRQDPFDYKREDLLQGKLTRGRISIDWDGEFATPPMKFPRNGKFDHPHSMKFLYFEAKTGKSYVIEKSFNRFKLYPNRKWKKLYRAFKKGQSKKSAPTQAADLQSAEKKKTWMMAIA